MKDRDRIASERVGSMVGGKYRIVSLVGSGGMGCVYEAQNTWTRRRVAIKFLHSEAAADPDIVSRFMREAQSPAVIAHPNIVEIIDLGFEPDDAPYIVQEFLHGSNLKDVLAQRRLSLEDALDIAMPCMSALAAAHRVGIVHRDIKPANIFVTSGRKGQVVPKLIDFGLAKLLRPTPTSSDEISAAAFGTPRYMSPEQIRAAPDLDGRTDVWSMGVVLYEMLAGTSPFAGATPVTVMQQILEETPPRLDRVTALCPPELAEIVHQALHIERDARLPTMAGFLEAVASCRGGWQEPDDDDAWDPIVGRSEVSRERVTGSGILLPDDDSMALPSVHESFETVLPIDSTEAEARESLPDEEPAAAAERQPAAPPGRRPWRDTVRDLPRGVVFDGPTDRDLGAVADAIEEAERGETKGGPGKPR